MMNWDSSVAFDGLCLDNLVPDAKFEMEILASRLSETDSLVQSFRIQTQEIEDLKLQLASLNDSSIQVNAFYQQEQQKSCRLQQERDEGRLRIALLERELADSRHSQVNGASFHKQVVADLEEKQAEHNLELIDLCKQYLIVGNLLADNHLSDGAINRTYMKVVELLKRKGESVDGLLKTTSSKKKKPKTTTAATMTNPIPPNIVPVNVPKITCSSSTMTDVPPAIPTSPRKTFCDRSVQHQPTTTTRGTTTSVFIQKVSVGTNYPEPVPLAEIFRQAIIEIPSPLSPILDFKWPTIDSGCQTSPIDEVVPNLVPLPPTTPDLQVHSVSTMTELANVRKRIGYTKLNAKQMQSGRTSLGAIYGIKKEENSPAGSMHNLSALAADHKQPIPPNAGGVFPNPISPQLSDLWSVLGQTIFSIIGSGRIFENSPSTLEMINTNLSHIRRVMESGHDMERSGTASVGESRPMEPNGDAGPSDRDDSDPTVHLEISEERDMRSEEEMEPMQLDSGLSMPLNPVSSQSPITSIQLAPHPVVTTSVPLQTPSETSSKIRVAAHRLSSSLPSDSTSVSTPCGTSSSSSPPTSQSTTTFISPLRAATTQTPSSVQPDDNAIFKKPTSAVRRLSPRQKAMTNKKPVISPSSYSIDRNFKRAKRKQQLSLIELTQTSPQQHPVPPNRPTSESETDVSDADMAQRKRPRIVECQYDIDNKDTNMEGIDAWIITQQFKAPELIEPIMDLDMNLVLFGDDEEDSDEELMINNVKLADKYTSVPKSPPRKSGATELSVIAELMGISSDSDEDSPAECPAKQSISSEISKPGPDHKSTEPETLDNYDCPASPTFPESPPTFDPPSKIPLETINVEFTSKTLATQVLDFTKVQGPRAKRPKPLNPSLFLRVFKIINHYLDETDCSEATITHCTMHLLHVTKSTKYFATCILEITEDIDEHNNSTSNGPIPSLTESHKRLVILIKRMDLLVPGFLEYCLLSLERSLFILGQNDMKIEAIINLVRLFVALNDLRPNVSNSRIRLFIYKCLYYFNHTSTPMVYTVLMAYPDCLPKLPETELVSNFPLEEFQKFDPLVQTIHTILMNSGYSTNTMCRFNSESYRKKELSFLQRNFYRYPGTRHNYADLVQHLLDLLQQNDLYNVDYALILIAKRKGVTWAQTNLLGISGLPKLLREFVRQSLASDEHDDQIVTVLTVIAAVVKTYPLTEDISGIHDLFTWTLETIPADRQDTQEAAIAALLMTARYGSMDVFNRIRQWTPPFNVSRKLKTQLQTFFHRKPLQFWT